MSADLLTQPALLIASHRVDAFECGVPVLDEWLRRRALSNQTSDASRTYVVCTDDDLVIGYYSLAAGAIALGDAPGPVRRNMPDPIPVIVLGRLAVDQRWQSRGIGAALLRDATLRVAHAADAIGVRALLVHALSEDVAQFYRAAGFIDSVTGPLTLCLPIETARRALEELS